MKTVLLLIGSILASIHFAEAQQPKRIYRIGYLSGGNPTTSEFRSDRFRQALRELGYIEGQNIVIDYRYAERKFERVPELAAELVHLKVDVIVVAGGIPVVRPAKNATKTIPIVMLLPADPVDAGLIESLARPGTNVTGLTTLNRELGGKRLELLKAAIPKLSTVAVLYERATPGIVREVKEDLPVAARSLRVNIQPWEVRDGDDFDRVFEALDKRPPTGLYLPGGPLMSANGKLIASFAVKQRLPSMYGNRLGLEGGGLMYYGSDLTDSYRRVASYVDKILRGAKPADLPVEQPTKFELIINLKTAKQIGLTIPPNVLARADRVIK